MTEKKWKIAKKSERVHSIEPFTQIFMQIFHTFKHMKKISLFFQEIECILKYEIWITIWMQIGEWWMKKRGKF